MNRSDDDPSVSYAALYGEAFSEAEADGTSRAIASAVDRVLARHHVAPDRAARWRERMIEGLSKLMEFLCPKDFGPTLGCRFMQGHLDEGLPHEPLWRWDEPLIEEIREYLYLLEADPDVQR